MKGRLVLADGGPVPARHGAASKVTLYRWAYRLAAPLFPILRKLAPKFVTTTENLGRALITLAHSGTTDRIPRSHQVNALAEQDS